MTVVLCKLCYYNVQVCISTRNVNNSTTSYYDIRLHVYLYFYFVVYYIKKCMKLYVSNDNVFTILLIPVNMFLGKVHQFTGS